jgi:carbamoyl-phosphate synthase large subunit
MPGRDDLQSILILGSGPIVIGQAAEFDDSGAQAVMQVYPVVAAAPPPARLQLDPLITRLVG